MDPTDLDLPAPQDVPGLLMQSGPLAIRVTDDNNFPMTIPVDDIARIYPTRMKGNPGAPRDQRDIWRQVPNRTTIVFRSGGKHIVRCEYEDVELVLYGQVPSVCAHDEEAGDAQDA